VGWDRGIELTGVELETTQYREGMRMSREAKVFIEYDQEQGMLFPPHVGELVGESHPARLVSEIVDGLDISSLERKAEEEHKDGGRPGYHPRMMLKLLVYAYSMGLRSSRKIEALCKENVVFMWLSGWSKPDHSVIAEFRRKNGEGFKELMRKCLEVGREMGLKKLGEMVLVDGTKIRANASRHGTAGRERLEEERKRLEEEITRRMKEAEAKDAKEEAKGEGGERELPKGLRQKEERKGRLERAIEAVKVQEAEGKQGRVSATDPDARPMKMKDGGCQVAYNGQVGVETGAGLITAAVVSQNSGDSGSFVPIVRESKEAVGEALRKAGADSGYASGANVKGAEELGVETYIAEKGGEGEGKEGSGYGKERFEYDKERDEYRCPAGQVLSYERTTRERVWGREEREFRLYRCQACKGCAKKGECFKGERNRKIRRDEYDEYRERNRARYRSKEGEEIRKVRWLVERVLGITKGVRGFVNFLLRGLDGATTEWRLMALAYNVTRLASLRAVSG